MQSQSFHAGFGLKDYTPPPSGAFKVYDPISFRAMVLRQGEVNVTFLSGDIFSIEADLLDRVKARVADIGWLNPDHILPCASHIGTCPILFQSYVNQPCEALKYFGREDWFADHMADAIRQAAGALEPARIGLGSAAAPGILYNRRSYDRDGKLVMSNFKFPYPRPELSYGPVDDHVYVMRIDDTDGVPRQAAISFGCHALCSTDKYGHISADYPGVARSVLENAGMEALFLPGSIGNVVPVSRAGRTYQRVGNSVGGASLYALEQTETTDSPGLTVKQEILDLQAYPQPALQETEAVLADTSPTSDGLQRFQVYGSRHRDSGEATMHYPITRIMINDTCLIHLPGEIFVETAQAIKAAAGDRQTIVLSGPTADVGYLSPPEAHQEGGMEPMFAGLSEDAETEIREMATGMVEGIDGLTD